MLVCVNDIRGGEVYFNLDRIILAKKVISHGMNCFEILLALEEYDDITVIVLEKEFYGINNIYVAREDMRINIRLMEEEIENESKEESKRSGKERFTEEEKEFVSGKGTRIEEGYNEGY